MLSTSQCCHEEDMCANKHPKNYRCIFNGSRDIQQTSILDFTDPARVLVLQTEREFRRVKSIIGHCWSLICAVRYCEQIVVSCTHKFYIFSEGVKRAFEI